MSGAQDEVNFPTSPSPVRMIGNVVEPDLMELF